MLLHEPFHFNSRHWSLALLIAVVVHMILFLSYKPSRDSGVEVFSQKSLVINLKKLTFPPKVEPPPIVQPKVDPLPEFKPEPKPEPKLKPVVKLKPQLEPKPSSIVKPVKIYEPKVEPIQYDSIHRDDNDYTQIDSENRKFDLSPKRNYESQLLGWLERHKKYPILARRRGQQGTVILEFVINTEGKLLSHKILQASAHRSLNTAVVEMIKQASPMPPIPK